MGWPWRAPVLNQPNSRFGWLAPCVALGRDRRLRPLPFGWRWLPVLDRHAAYRVPVWMYWPAVLWINRWWALEPFVRAGLLTVREGGDWREARPWFWNAEREASFRDIFNIGRE